MQVGEGRGVEGRVEDDEGAGVGLGLGWGWVEGADDLKGGGRVLEGEEGAGEEGEGDAGG